MERVQAGTAQIIGEFLNARLVGDRRMGIRG
jgi:hypothetical protein